MKTIEQKAKAYDEAIRKAKDMLSYKEVRQEDIEYLFPELKESEDERIRKELCKAIWTFIPNEKAHKYIAWLEKLKVFSEHGYGLYYFGNNGFTYVSNPTCDNVSWIEKQGEKPQGKSALEAWEEEMADNANKVASAWNNGYSNGYIHAIDKACEWLENHNDYIDVKDGNITYFDMEKCVEDFKKAMEHE